MMALFSFVNRSVINSSAGPEGQPQTASEARGRTTSARSQRLQPRKRSWPTCFTSTLPPTRSGWCATVPARVTQPRRPSRQRAGQMGTGMPQAIVVHRSSTLSSSCISWTPPARRSTLGSTRRSAAPKLSSQFHHATTTAFKSKTAKLFEKIAHTKMISIVRTFLLSNAHLNIY